MGFKLTPKRNEFYPLSFAQQRMWFLSQLLPDIPLYNVTKAFELSGAFHIEAMRQSLNEIFRRHEALRTTFPVFEQGPLQRIAPPQDFLISMKDLSGLSPDERDELIKHLLTDEGCQLFSLVEGPLFRASMIRISDTRHFLLLSMHHIICDGLSLRNLFQELSALYNAFSKGFLSPLPQLRGSYSDFAEAQQASLETEEMRAQINYWIHQLEGSPPLLKLPYDFPRPPIQDYRGSCLSFELSSSLYHSLVSFSHKNRVTLYITLLAAFNVLLSRYSGQEDILIGSTIANRASVELEPLIGVFVNTLVIRSDLRGDPTFDEFLQRVRETALDAYANQDAPFEKVIEQMQPERLLGQSPLFQVLFDFQRDPDDALQFDNLNVRPIRVANGTSKFDLTLTIVESKKGITGGFEYSTALFQQSMIQRMIGHLGTLLREIIEHSSRPISTLPLLTSAERHQLIVEWNQTTCEYPRECGIHELFEKKAQDFPEAIALDFENRKQTYRELNSESTSLAQYIVSCGIKPGSVIGVCLESSIEMIVAMLAILKAGAAYLPLDPSYPFDRLLFMYKDSGACMLLTSSSLAAKIGAWGHTSTVLMDENKWANVSRGDDLLPSHVGGEEPAYIMYTSGSTGRPKGVCVPHRAVIRLVRNTNYITFSPNDRVAQISNTSFDAMTFELWGALLNGASLISISKEIAIFPGELVKCVCEKQISILFLTTGLFHFTIREIPDAFRSVDQLFVGGEALDPNWIRLAIKNGRPGRIVNAYGPTEATTFATTYEIDALEEAASSVPIGRPISNTQLYILDSHLEPLPINIAGEIFIGGDGLACGYLNRPDLTAERFLQNPFSNDPAARLYRTGDLGRWRADGNIEFLGRVDHQIKIRGFRVEPEEIQVVLMQHPEVEQSLVLDMQAPAGDRKLVSYVVARPKHTPSTKELREFLKSKLPDYMVPSHFLFVESFAVTPAGKIDRASLPLPFWKSNSPGPNIPPRNPVEQAIVDVWSEILNHQNIAIDENFFDLGGHSLPATQVILRLQKMFNMELPLLALFEAPTVRKLAKRIGAEIARVQTIRKNLTPGEKRI